MLGIHFEIAMSPLEVRGIYLVDGTYEILWMYRGIEGCIVVDISDLVDEDDIVDRCCDFAACLKETLKDYGLDDL